MLRSDRLVIKIALASTLALSWGTTALAADLFRWRQANGNLAFTDDEKRVPDRHRASAEKVSTGELAEYGRYTPADGAAVAAYGEGLSARVERLKALNARLDALHAALDEAGALAADDLRVRFDERGATTLETTAPGAGHEPVIVEEVRLRVPGTEVTRHDTIVRRGDRVLTIRRPRAHETYVPGVLEYESDAATLR